MIDLNDIRITLVETKHETACQFNYSIKEICDAIKCNDITDFYTKLKEHGIRANHPIKASSEDVKDYLEIREKYASDKFDPIFDCDRYDKFDHIVLNVILNTIYYDEPFTDETTGKVGLKDSCGMIVVPAQFDDAVGAYDIGFVETLAKVKFNGKYYLTPRDGSGKLMTEEGYDEMSRSCGYAWVELNRKKGKLDAVSGEVIIPCEMDWLINESGLLIRRVFGKNGKVGFAEFNPFNSMLEYYANPIYDAIDLMRNRYLFNGKWLYISNEGKIVDKRTPKFQDVAYWSSPDSYLDDEYRKCPYEDIVRIDQRFTRNYPSFEFSDELKVDEKITDALCSAMPLVDAGLNTVVIRFNLPEKKSSMFAGLKFSRKDDKTVIEPIWESNDQELLFNELTYPNIKCFNSLIKDIDGKFGMLFYREFSDSEINDIEKLIADYFINHLGISLDEIALTLTDEANHHTYNEVCRLNDKSYRPLQDIGIFVFGENDSEKARMPHFHIIGNNCDIQIEINEFNEVKAVYESHEAHMSDELRKAIAEWLPLPSIEIGFTNAELLRFVWNINNPGNKIQ